MPLTSLPKGRLRRYALDGRPRASGSTYPTQAAVAAARRNVATCLRRHIDTRACSGRLRVEQGLNSRIGYRYTDARVGLPSPEVRSCIAPSRAARWSKVTV